MRDISDIREIDINDFDYELPDLRIAQYPLEARDRSKMLIYSNGMIDQDLFVNLPNHLPEQGTVIFNDTRVIHARLIFRKVSGTTIEIFCLEPLAPSGDFQNALQQTGSSDWLCLVGNAKRWKNGQIELFTGQGNKMIRLVAERFIKEANGTSRIKFGWSPENISFAEVLEAAGKMPLPPYIRRSSVQKDESTYQTIFAKLDGSVAAPTAGLHFSDQILSSLTEKGIDTLKFTLHVGAGTFKPVSSARLADHEMHAEQIFIPLETLGKLKSSLDKPIIAVGTTTTRLLESLYWHGVKVIKGLSEGPVVNVSQWDPYDIVDDPEISREEALDAIIKNCKSVGAKSIWGKTSLLIAPGYTFRFPDILITNFHQPKSTLLLLIAAFIGEDWKKAYQYALENDFRFLSYGDSCLFFRENPTNK
jgi:S-adenosylmethionine:tRNA ribosyltransferase-isomerase